MQAIKHLHVEEAQYYRMTSACFYSYITFKRSSPTFCLGTVIVICLYLSSVLVRGSAAESFNLLKGKLCTCCVQSPTLCTLKHNLCITI